MVAFVLWFSGALFTIGFVVLGDTTHAIERFSGDKLLLGLFSFVIWPLMLGVSIREKVEGVEPPRATAEWEE